MNLRLNRSAQKSVKMSSFLSHTNRQFNHLNTYSHRSLNDLPQMNSTLLVSKSSHSTSTSSSSSSSTHDYLYNNTLQDDHSNSVNQCPYCTVQLNTSQSYPFHSEFSKTLKNRNINNEVYNSNGSLKLPICSGTNTHCSCYFFKQISSPQCYSSTNDVSSDQNKTQYNVPIHTNLSNSHYSLPIKNTCSNDQMIETYHLNENSIENIDDDDLKNWNHDHYFYHHYNDNLTRTTTTTPALQQKINNNNHKKRLQAYSKSLYWNKPIKHGKINKIASTSNSQLKHYFPVSFSTVAASSRKDRQSLKHIKQDIHYIAKAARQLLVELKEREFKAKIIEQWKIVGIVLDRIFFILYFVTILLSALLFHPTLIDDYSDD
ncbi:unnamed protein product [Schistosoma turkestanicum]|nr:unnamed protein product [Schistosoma turkestanicum]